MSTIALGILTEPHGQELGHERCDTSCVLHLCFQRVSDQETEFIIHNLCDCLHCEAAVAVHHLQVVYR